MKTLQHFRSVRIIDGTGADARIGDVFVQDGRITTAIDRAPDMLTDVIEGEGLTLMPGMCDAHSHLGLIDADYFSMTEITPEDHYQIAARNARTVLEAGYTMCMGAGAAKEGQDVALRLAIDEGRLPGPHLLAAGAEISASGSYVDLPDGSPFAATPAVIASGEGAFRREAARICATGIDILKLGLSGDNGTPHAPASSTAMTDAEVEAAVAEARLRGVRVHAHARSAQSVQQCLKFGVELISHADLIEDAEIEELARRRDEFFVIPAMAYLARPLEGAAESIGFTAQMARDAGLERELEQQVRALKRLRALGVRILTGGDYGFAWTPHGTNARDLGDFVGMLDYSPLEAITAATSLGALALRRSEALGRIAPGYAADLLLISGDPLADITILQDADRLVGVMKGGKWVKEPSRTQGAAPS